MALGGGHVREGYPRGRGKVPGFEPGTSLKRGHPRGWGKERAARIRTWNEPEDP